MKPKRQPLRPADAPRLGEKYRDWRDFTERVARPWVDNDGDDARADNWYQTLMIERDPYYLACALVLADNQIALLRRVLGEYVQGNQIIDGYWWAPERSGLPRYQKQTCPECDGKGGILVDSMLLYGVPGGEDWDRCPTCKGKDSVLVAEEETDETGAPHYKNDKATPEELALVASFRDEVGP